MDYAPTLTSLHSPPHTHYANFEFSELFEFDDWAAEDLTMMISGYAINPVYAPNEAPNNAIPSSSSSHLEGRDGGSKPEKKEKVAFRILSENIEILDDGFKWRKYGKKMVKNSPNPRNYYKCSIEGCEVKKRVERDREDPRYVITTYDGVHNHQAS